MEQTPRDEVRENRITMEIIVDAYGPEEQALGWYYYLENQMSFPFHARCSRERRISPLRMGDEIEIVGMAPEEECAHEMFVLTPWERDTLAVPLVQVEPIGADEETQRAVADWRYWVGRGYEL
jgi:hypothetical protein